MRVFRFAPSTQVLNAFRARSDRLKNLLRFLCEAEIEGRAAELSEYAIGVQALGQPESYSPAENSTVRSRVHELRQRLDKFYRTESPAAGVQIQLAKGTYVPRFVRAEHPATEIVVPPAEPRRLPIWVPILAAFVAGIAATASVLPRPAATPSAAGTGTRWTPGLEAVWSPFVEGTAPVLLSFESRLFLRIGSVAVRDWSVDEMAGVEGSQRLMAIKDLFHQPQIYENRNYAEFGAVQAAFSIARRLGTRNSRLILKRSSGVGPDDAQDNDVIFLSSQVCESRAGLRC